METEDTGRLLERFSDELGLMPILIFDQFDDYQTRHRDRFLRGTERTILTAKRLVAQDASQFRDLAEGLEALAENLHEDTAKIVASRVVELMARSRDIDALSSIAKSLGAMEGSPLWRRVWVA